MLRVSVFTVSTSGFPARPARRTADPSSARPLYMLLLQADIFADIHASPDTRQCHALQPAAGLRSSVTRGTDSVTDVPERSNGFNSNDFVLLPAALRAAQTCRYLVYSEADFEVFRHAGVTRCTDGG